MIIALPYGKPSDRPIPHGPAGTAYYIAKPGPFQLETAPIRFFWGNCHFFFFRPKGFSFTLWPMDSASSCMSSFCRPVRFRGVSRFTVTY